MTVNASRARRLSEVLRGGNASSVLAFEAADLLDTAIAENQGLLDEIERLNEEIATLQTTRTVEQARDDLTDKLLTGETGICEVCDQDVKLYKRQIHSSMARELIVFYKRAGMDWGYIPEVLKDHRQGGGDFAKLRYWKLIEEQEGLRPDGSTRTGIWRVTAHGKSFIDSEILVQKHAHVFNGELFELDGPEVSIQDALGKRFNYRELMSN